METVIKSLYREMESFGGKEVTISGWVRTVRASNAFGFIELNDGSFFSSIQVVIESDKLSNYAELAKLNVGAALTVTGVLELTPGAKQPMEIKATDVVIEGAAWTHAAPCWNKPLIYINEQENVKLTGAGTVRMQDTGTEWLDGNSYGWESDITANCNSLIHVHPIAAWKCNNLEIRDITIFYK